MKVVCCPLLAAHCPLLAARCFAVLWRLKHPETKHLVMSLSRFPKSRCGQTQRIELPNTITAAFCAVTVWLSFTTGLFGQSGPSELRVFGYFQPQFMYQNGPEGEGAYTSFLLQQLNILFQKDLGKGLSSFVNIEAVNSFSTRDGWGSMRIEEAWVRYRTSRAFSLKAGLQIPIFNNFNEIKNRTPLIPYVIRPVVYESSLSSVLNNPLSVPQQAFLQAFGWAPRGSWKFDYAAYLGNTDHVVSSFGGPVEDIERVNVSAGIDTSAAALFGYRPGGTPGSALTPEKRLLLSYVFEKPHLKPPFRTPSR